MTAGTMMQRSGAIGGIALLAACVAAASAATDQAARTPRSAGTTSRTRPAWQKLLLPPATTPTQLPADWKNVSMPKSFSPKGGGPAPGSFGQHPAETADALMRESAVVVVGIGAGSDGGFLVPWIKGGQFTSQYITYYLRVEGYVKDATGRRAPFLKVLAPGGYLNGGEGTGDGLPFPYLETGRRYLLYLTPNTGYTWGIHVLRDSPDHVPTGRGDEYWTTSQRFGLFRTDADGKLIGSQRDEWEWESLGLRLPFGRAVERVTQAAVRERKGLPPPAPQLPTGVSSAYRAWLLKHKADYEEWRKGSEGPEE